MPNEMSLYVYLLCRYAISRILKLLFSWNHGGGKEWSNGMIKQEKKIGALIVGVKLPFSKKRIKIKKNYYLKVKYLA